jgi:GMC oxidoreductase
LQKRDKIIFFLKIMNLTLLLVLLCTERVLSKGYNAVVSETETYKTINELYLNSTRTSSARNGKFLWGYKPQYIFRYPGKEYDYIIVGAGNAGCVLANRLTENPAITVLLVESGKAEIPLASDIPLTAGILQSTDFNYGYVTEPQTKACLGENRPIIIELI